MGVTRKYVCNECRGRYFLRLGVGHAYPGVCDGVLRAIRAGECGEGLKDAAESERYVGVDAGAGVFL